jgi:hypothetical protein
MDYYETAEGVESKIPAYSQHSVKKLLTLAIGSIALLPIACGLAAWIDQPPVSTWLAFAGIGVSLVGIVTFLVLHHTNEGNAKKAIVNDIETEKPGFKEFYAAYQKQKAEEDAEKQRIILRGVVVGVTEGYRAHRAMRQVGRDIKKEFRKY